ncbi:DUF5994 family protein [Streptomyces sp. NPDC088560]|uniref:DUF5994 family protein n=1 Tax=Streptomyces sp. NPDC088560 TaxID=3365868 RepID=UPI0038020C45
MTSDRLRLPPPAPPLLRLYLAPESTVPRRIDGAWWPRTFDLPAELPPLLSGLPRAWGQTVGVLANGTAGTGAPGLISSAARSSGCAGPPRRTRRAPSS